MANEEKREKEEKSQKSQAANKKDTQTAPGQNAENKAKADEKECASPCENNVEKELEAEKEKNAELNDKFLRLRAEFDNYKKRTLKEKAELIKNGSEKSVASFLPIIDDMERALKVMENAEDINAMREGIKLIYDKFMDVLTKNGVAPIETKDLAFDTDEHEAVAIIPAPSEEAKGKVVECVQTGYKLNDKVIRHAKVVVAQ